MPNLTRWLVLALLLCASACEAGPPYERTRGIVVRMETGIGQCSATMVGPNLLLSAEHCGVSTPGRLLLDGVPVDVLEVATDGRDHVLIRVDTTFKRWAELGKPPRPGDAVYVIGSPEGLKKILRLGYFVGQVDAPSPEASVRANTDLFDLEAGHGDSGAAIMDRKGRIIAVLTGGYTPTHDFRLIRAIPLGFTAEQWREVAR